jgi:hypothetical protein
VRKSGVQQTEKQKLNQRQGKLKPKNDWETPDFPEAQERLGNTRWIDARSPNTKARGLLITEWRKHAVGKPKTESAERNREEAAKPRNRAMASEVEERTESTRCSGAHRKISGAGKMNRGSTRVRRQGAGERTEKSK